VEGGEPVNITRHPRNDSSPSWSADGRALVFLSERDTDTPNIYFVYLRKEDDEKTRADRDDEEDARYDAPKKEEKPDQKSDTPVRIDFDDIHLRIRPVTRYAEGVQEAVIAPRCRPHRLSHRLSGAIRPLHHQVGWHGREAAHHRWTGAKPNHLEQRWQNALFSQSGTAPTHSRYRWLPPNH
jgi:hypothetical protein